MLFISLINCLILSVIAVQPIDGAADVKSLALAPTGQNDSQPIVFSDSYSKPKSNEQPSDGSSSNPAKPSVEKSHSRGVSKTDRVPSNEDHDSNISGNKSITEIKSENIVELSNQTNSAKSNQETKVVQQDPAVDKSSIDSKPKTASAASSTSTTTTTITSSTSTSTTTTTTTTTPKPTTTTPAPKKPLITQSVEDIPGLLSKAAEAHPQLTNPLPAEDGGSNEPHSLQSSEKITYRSYQLPNHNWVMTIVGIIVVIPLIIVVSNCAVRKARDIWSKRRYRRMDYLIEDMYN